MAFGSPDRLNGEIQKLHVSNAFQAILKGRLEAMAFCIPFTHRYRATPGPGSGLLFERCERCGKVRAHTAPPLLVQIQPRLDLDPNPRRWIPGPGVSSGGEVGERNPLLGRGFPNDD